jgi:hypothetical protein
VEGVTVGLTVTDIWEKPAQGVGATRIRMPQKWFNGDMKNGASSMKSAKRPTTVDSVVAKKVANLKLKNRVKHP